MSKVIKLVTSVLSILLSIALIVLGISISKTELVFEADTISVSAPQLYDASGSYSYTLYQAYGGDAYTGMQQASADAANNVAQVGHAIEIMNGNLDVMTNASNSNAKAISKQIERAISSFNEVNTVLQLAGYLIVLIGAFLLLHYLSRFAECISAKKRLNSGDRY